MKILLVDDSAFDRTLATSILRQSDGYDVTAVSNGRDALQILTSDQFDLVISDLQMPEMDGLSLLCQMQERHPNLPTIVITSFGNEETALRALQAGAHSYVPKRYLRQALRTAVQTVLNARSEQKQEEELLCSVIQHEIVLSLPSNRDRIAPTVKYLQKLTSAMGLVDQTREVHLGVALEEALSNAIIHGNLEVSSRLREQDDDAYGELISERSASKEYGQRRVTVRAGLNCRSATFTISDEGPGFDVKSLPDPTDPENLLRPSGRGVMLMSAFMDSITFNDVGNSVTLLLQRELPSDALPSDGAAAAEQDTVIGKC
jgi:CheY-like chemotaxis protein/anti-sigma regulatory factor (Ser/Thr protein kinase)